MLRGGQEVEYEVLVGANAYNIIVFFYNFANIITL